MLIAFQRMESISKIKTKLLNPTLLAAIIFAFNRGGRRPIKLLGFAPHLSLRSGLIVPVGDGFSRFTIVKHMRQELSTMVTANA